MILPSFEIDANSRDHHLKISANSTHLESQASRISRLLTLLSCFSVAIAKLLLSTCSGCVCSDVALRRTADGLSLRTRQACSVIPEPNQSIWDIPVSLSVVVRTIRMPLSPNSDAPFTWVVRCAQLRELAFQIDVNHTRVISSCGRKLRSQKLAITD